MKKIFALTLIAATVGTAASAQAGPTQKQTTEELVCQLSGDCGATEVAADRQQQKGATRGFSIYRPTTGATAPTKNTPAAPVRNQRQGAVADTRQRTPAMGRNNRFAVVRPANVGRAQLMVNFVSGSAQLTDSSRDSAMALVGAVNAPQLAGKRFAVEGHTDSVGSRATNLDLSQRRAQAVVDFLTKNGVDRSRFDVHGFGPDKPMPGLGARDGRNRRVEVVLIK